MANNKIGFAYYNADTDRFQDMRIKRLKKNMECDGFAVYEYILNEIYRVKGCFLVWDESAAFDVADYWGLRESTVNEIVNYCGSVGLFNKELLSRGGIRTSLSIQSRYMKMCKRSKRLGVKIPKAIKLLEESDIPPEESPKPPEESGQNGGSLPQSKVKKSKEERINTMPEEKIPAYSPCMKIYNDFCLEKLGVKAKIDGTQRKALKSIIKYQRKTSFGTGNL